MEGQLEEFHEMKNLESAKLDTSIYYYFIIILSYFYYFIILEVFLQLNLFFII